MLGLERDLRDGIFLNEPRDERCGFAHAPRLGKRLHLLAQRLHASRTKGSAAAAKVVGMAPERFRVTLLLGLPDGGEPTRRRFQKHADHLARESGLARQLQSAQTLQSPRIDRIVVAPDPTRPRAPG